MSIETELLEKTRAHAEAILSSPAMEKFVYHSLAHTREVVAACQEIGLRTGIDKKDLETVLIAAWLHDTGYSQSTTEHEEASIAIARQFLEQYDVGHKRIDKVLECIQATKMPQHPTTPLAEILCDADLRHLATERYAEKAELLRQEMIAIKGQALSPDDWERLNAGFMREHVYFTEYGRHELQPLQDKNLRKLEKKMRKRQEHGDDERAHEEIKRLEKELAKVQAKLAEEKLHKPGRGVETMFRTTSTNHLELSSIADNKANIMISINSIIVSLLVSVLIRKFEEFPNLIVPTAILTTVCLFTIVFAVLATRPNVSLGKFSREDVHEKRTNLLFFGNFYRMELEDYEWGMKETLKDSNLLYTSMIRDIYFLGKVLGRKYELLRISYTIFMYGFVFSVLSYAIALIFYPVY